MIARLWALAILGSIALSASAQEDAKIEALVKKLGHSSFVQRETARKELEAIGIPALDPLRRAGKTADVETRRRIDELIRSFEERLLTQQILAPKEVHLKLENATVQQAINELASKSGYPLQFIGDATLINDKKITLDTGKVSFWHAFDRLGAAAGLMEKVDFDDRPSTGYVRKNKQGRIYYPGQKPTGPSAILLTPRGNEKSLVNHSGAVRTELRVARDEKAKELTLTFVVSVEPRMYNSGVVGRPVVDRLLDQAGRPLEIPIDAPKTDAKPDDAVYYEPVDLVGLPGRFAQVRVKEGPDAAKLLKEIAGKLLVQVELQNEPLAKIANVLGAAGKSVDGPAGGTLKVQSVKKRDNGEVELEVVMDNLTPDPFGGAVVINGNNIVIRGNVNIRGGMIIGNGGVRMNGPGTMKDLPDLLDAKGQKFKVARVDLDNMNFVNGSVSRSATVVYQANPEQAAPQDLVLYGARTHVIGVPFRFEKVQLP